MANESDSEIIRGSSGVGKGKKMFCELLSLSNKGNFPLAVTEYTALLLPH